VAERSIFHVVVGTAGHIDHGKSTLVRRLTGVDPDRLPEEQARAMTIDLGFAPLELPDGRTVGVIDVPGHERFIKNMVAGATGIDVGLLVVDANEGVMPQTREHLEIMGLLGIRRGLVALTKVDTAGEELAELAAEEVREELAGSFLAEAPILAVSAMTGDGIGALLEAIAEACRAVGAHDASGPFRMPIQRVFSARGFGTIVTGVPLSGSVGSGDVLEIVPLGARGRVRGVQAYKGEVPRGHAGHSTALNVADVDYKQVHRGMVACEPGAFSGGHLFEARLEVLPSAARPLEHMASVRVHAGTAEALGRLAVLEGGELMPGDSALVQLRLREPLVVAPGDRFILRDPPAAHTLGGGTVLALGGRRLKPNRGFVLDALRRRERSLGSGEALTEDALRAAGARPITPAALALATGLGREATARHTASLSAAGRATTLRRGGALVHADALGDAERQVTAALSAHFQSSPLALTADRLELKALAGLDPVLFEDALDAAMASGAIERRTDGALALPGRDVTLTERQQRRRDELLALYHGAGVQPPTPEEATAAVGAREGDIDEVRALLRLLGHAGEVVEVSAGLWFSREAVERAREELLRPFRAGDEFSAADFRDRLGTTRKWAIPLLEHFDAQGLTERRGSTRVLKTPLGELA
jgi:selenocysteine-specific elongation factor